MNANKNYPNAARDDRAWLARMHRLAFQSLQHLGIHDIPNLLFIHWEHGLILIRILIISDVRKNLLHTVNWRVHDKKDARN